MNNMLDIIILVIGIYFLLATNSMKINGRINRFIVGKKYDLSIAKDVPGFISYMYKKNVAIGFITLATAFIHSLYVGHGGSNKIGNLIYGIYLVLYMIYAVFLLKAQRKYLDPK